MKAVIGIAAGVGAASLAIASSAAGLECTLELTTRNPSVINRQPCSIKRYLPVGWLRENIVDAGIFDVRFDVARGQYALMATFVLEPGASPSDQIVLRDRWPELDAAADRPKVALTRLTGHPRLPSGEGAARKGAGPDRALSRHSSVISGRPG